jgi:hypothetical protein
MARFRFWPVPLTIDLSNLPLRFSSQGISDPKRQTSRAFYPYAYFGFPLDEHLLSNGRSRETATSRWNGACFHERRTTRPCPYRRRKIRLSG